MKKITIATLIIGLIAGIGLTSSLGNVENVHANPNMGGMTIEEARGVITDQVNKERKKAGKKPLIRSVSLDAYAQEWATVQAKDKTMKHREDFSKWPGKPTYMGENVAYGYSVTDVMNGWMNSKGHRDNILEDEFNAIGIGVAADSSGRLFYTQNFAKYKDIPSPVIPGSRFTDVRPGDKFYKEIMWLADRGITTGVSQIDGTQKYLPKDSVTREAMAAFLFRIEAPKNYKSPSKSPFVDVKTSDKFYKEITWMHTEGISTGIKINGKLYYKPKSNITREAMAAFLYRIESPKNYKSPSKSYFTDVHKNSKFYTEIMWMYNTGVSTGTKQKDGSIKYMPLNSTTREAMAAFLYRIYK